MHKKHKNCPDTLIYYTTDLYPPQPAYENLWGYFLFMGMFSVYENLFLFMIIWGGLFLWESLLIYDHLWESFLFMRISSYFWSSVRISSFYENFFESLHNYYHLWEFLLSSDQLFYYLFFITLAHLCVLILIFFYHSCIHFGQ